jgi:gluconolactonase
MIRFNKNNFLLVSALLIAAGCNPPSNRTETIVLRADPAIDDIVPQDADLTVIDTGFQFTEGPVWDPEGGMLFSDIPEDMIYRWKEGKGISVFMKNPGNSNGLTFDNDENLVYCSHGKRAVVMKNSDGSLTELASHWRGKRLNSPNDLIISNQGIIYFTDPCWGLIGNENSPDKEVAFNGVYMLNGTELKVVDSSLWRPNGVALSPDEKTLYVSDMFINKTPDITVLYKYALDDAGNPVSKDSIVLHSPKDEILGEEGGFDGIKTDTEGNIYCSGPHGIVIISAEGKYLGTIVTPEMPANCAWGDNDYSTLYITARKQFYRIALDAEGFSPQRLSLR